MKTTCFGLLFAMLIVGVWTVSAGDWTLNTDGHCWTNKARGFAPVRVLNCDAGSEIVDTLTQLQSSVDSHEHILRQLQTVVDQQGEQLKACNCGAPPLPATPQPASATSTEQPLTPTTPEGGTTSPTTLPTASTLNTPTRTSTRETRLTSSKTASFANCQEARRVYPDSGVRNLTVGRQEFQVYCDQNTAGGGWTVIQRRREGIKDFNRVWLDYVDGFGYLEGEFWLGLKKIHSLSTRGRYTLRFDLTDWDMRTAFAEYDPFYIDGPEHNYRIHLGIYNGTAGNSMMDPVWNHNEQPFSTKDRDNDRCPTYSCGAGLRAGWWYNCCQAANVNAPLCPQGENGAKCTMWKAWVGDRSIKGTEMKIRPLD